MSDYEVRGFDDGTMGGARVNWRAPNRVFLSFIDCHVKYVCAGLRGVNF